MSARPNLPARGMAAITFVLLAGCAAVPDLGNAPQLAAPDGYETSQSFAGPVAAWPSDQWWEAYGDAQLNALVEEALQDLNTDRLPQPIADAVSDEWRTQSSA